MRLLFVLVFALSGQAIFAQLSSVEIARRVDNSVVVIETYNARREPIGQGSGVVVSADGKIITNYHVVEDGKYIVVKHGDKQYHMQEMLYSDPERDRKLIAVVEEPLDIIALERTGQFKGTYHVLGGAISPIDGIGPEQLHIPELLKRLVDDEVEEVIIATNASVEGESTALFLQRHIKDADIEVRMTRLARGIPVGVDLEYADQITLGHALEGRRTL